jgi:MinD-like ATPase involved in chromosome partitioning or flagellar assembly
MKTITFYSYKGGVGRSLALVNIATRLSEFGKKVCIIDFDLEAPGLHIKFPTPSVYLADDYKGIVDYVYKFSNEGILDNKIKDYSFDIPVLGGSVPLTLIPAGNTSNPKYWMQLSKIDWYNLIYDNPNGLAFFLNLKEVIKKEIKPDYLLIDSRTGISEMSGISLSLLADEVVIIAANNKENLSGARNIIRSLSKGENNILGKQPKINFVLSRVPFTDNPEDRSKEQLLLNRIKREYLLPFVKDINIIHSDRELEEVERVKIAYEKDESSTQISIDYLKLFESLTSLELSNEEVERFKRLKQSERYMRLANGSYNLMQKIEYLSKAIEFNPVNPELYNTRAGVNIEFKDYKSALNDIQDSLKINPNNLNSRRLLVETYLHTKEYGKAMEVIDQILDKYPTDIITLLRKTIVLCHTGKLKEAEEIATAVIEIDPELSQGFSTRGNIRRMLKNYQDAFIDTYKSLELDSENLQAVATLAELYGETGNVNEFFIHFENSLKLDPEYMQMVIKEEEIYSSFKNLERFNNLLIKYGLIIN